MTLSQIIAKVKYLFWSRYTVFIKQGESGAWEKIESFSFIEFARCVASYIAMRRRPWGFAVWDAQTKKQVYGNLWGDDEFVADHSSLFGG